MTDEEKIELFFRASHSLWRRFWPRYNRIKAARGEAKAFVFYRRVRVKFRNWYETAIGL